MSAERDGGRAVCATCPRHCSLADGATGVYYMMMMDVGNEDDHSKDCVYDAKMWDYGWNGGYGQFVKIRHGNGYESAYGHMSGIAVTTGQQVRKGEIIGFVGSTGYSTGPHLHFEVFVDGENIDPLYMLKKAK